MLLLGAVEVDHEVRAEVVGQRSQDRKSTRLNSSHLVISYAVFCLKKKKEEYTGQPVEGEGDDGVLMVMVDDGHENMTCAGALVGNVGVAVAGDDNGQ